MNKKLSVLLATTDQLSPQFKRSIGDTGKFFKQNQSAFKGYKKTYSPLEGTVDDPAKRGVNLIVTTVDEKLDWIIETSKTYIDALFSQEATNASGGVKAELKVDNVSFGMFSSLELMRLKSILESEDLNNMYAQIPVREETKNWEKTTAENYEGRNIWEDELVKAMNRTTEKEGYILEDPNVASGKVTNYSPKIEYKTKTVDLGEYTLQNFTGEYSHRERAEILRRLTQLKTAVLEALKVANDAESIPSEMTSSKLFNFLHKGTL